MKVYKIIFTYFPSGNFAMWSFVNYKYCDLENFSAKVKIYSFGKLLKLYLYFYI